MPTPWDVYIDERKVKDDKALGYLVVPNTASFLRKLRRCRFVDGKIRPHELHWSNIRGDMRLVACRWIERVYQHKGARFFYEPWQEGRTKELQIIRFLDGFVRRKRLSPPYNVVTFLDYDDDHSRADIQNAIRQTANIARCYHLDSKNNDCLQCCDLMLNATLKQRRDPLVRSKYPDLKEALEKNGTLSCSGTKTYLAGVLAEYLDAGGNSVYDFGVIRKESEGKADSTTPDSAS